MTQFIKVNGKVINTDAIAYVDFLDSGRAMIFIRGLSPEKQHIPVDPEETRRLRALFEDGLVNERLAKESLLEESFAGAAAR